MDFHGQRVVVLGGTSGIGLATAQSAAEAGAAVVVVSSNKERIDAALLELPAGTDGRAVDLTDEAAVETFFASLGGFDHLVFTAGQSLALMELPSLDLAAARRFFDLRYFGALTAVRHGVGNINGGGSIVLTSGTAGLRAGSGWSVPASICGAMDALVRALAVELAPIRVNAVRPGVVRSPLWKSMSPAERERLYASTAASIPVGRVGEPADIAQAYLYLMGERYATGTIVTVDGGALVA